MAKLNIKNLIVDKGEKYAVFAAAGLMVLLMGIGIYNLTDAPDPKQITDEIDKHTQKINSTINGTGVIDPLSEDSKAVYLDTKVAAASMPNLLFDPINPPDKRRINPVLLALANIQADYVPAKILSYDIRELENGDLEFGVLVLRVASKGGNDDNDARKQFLKDINVRFKKRTNRNNANPMGANGLPPGIGMMGGARGGPMGASGGVGAPMGIGGIPRPPGLGGPGKPPGMPMPGGMMGMAGTGHHEAAQRLGIEYVPLDSEKLDGKRPALTIYPQRMVVVQAAFPYKAELEQIQTALRLEKLSEVLAPDNAPVFRGYVIERQILTLDGKLDVDWQPLNVEDRYRDTIYPRKYGDKEDDEFLKKVMLPDEHELTMPLPLLLSGNYPPIRMPQIQAAIQKMKALDKPVELPKGQTSRLTNKKEGSIFVRSDPSSVAAQGQPNLGVPKKKDKKKDDKNEAAGPAQAADMPDYVLVRVLDNDIVPGRQYRYRIKLRMVNPNWVGEKGEGGVPVHKNKSDLVSRPSDADVEIIESRYLELPDAVSVPREEFLFAADPVADPKKILTDTKPGQGILQYQRWLPYASVGSFKEPVADWIVADVVVKRGTKVGGKQFVNLPIWSSEFNRYILREVPPEKGSKSKEPRRGVVMDPTVPGPEFVVVDIEGGKIDAKLSLNKSVKDESATEILLLAEEDGKLSVRSSFFDRGDAGRAKREDMWRQWVDRTDKDTTELVPRANPMGKGTNFD